MRFQHDCDRCHYLDTGTVEGRHVDWYFCAGPCGGSIIGRTGDDAPDYWSLNVDTLRSAICAGVSSPMHLAAFGMIPTTLYETLRAAGIEIENHETDLYVRRTPEALALVKASGFGFSTFRDEIDGELWLDVPFAFDPAWGRKVVKPAHDHTDAGSFAAQRAAERECGCKP